MKTADELLPDGPPGPGSTAGRRRQNAWTIADETLPDEVNSIAKAITIIQPPRLIKEGEPCLFSDRDLSPCIGTVIIEAVTDIYGRVREAKVVSWPRPAQRVCPGSGQEVDLRTLSGQRHPQTGPLTVSVIFTLEKL